MQWCIFHLHKSIWKKLQEEFGKHAPLLQIYNVYNLFDIFFDHTPEIEKLQELLKTLNANKTGDSKRVTENSRKPCVRSLESSSKTLKSNEDANIS